MSRGKLKPVLAPNCKYQQWQKVGKLQQGVFQLYYTNSPRAETLIDGDPELNKERLNFPAASEGAYLYVRAKTPSSIEITTAVDESELNNNPKIKELDLS